MSAAGWALLAGGALALAAYLAAYLTEDHRDGLLDPRAGSFDQRTATALALLTPDALDEVPDTGIADEAEGWLRDWTTAGPSIPIIPDPRTREE